MRDEVGQDGTPYRLARQPLLTPNHVPCGPTPFGSIVAINLDTGKKLWSVPHGEMTKGEPGSIGVGGVIATAGGLLFVASSNDPALRAYDSATGAELWQSKLPVPANATPMTYTANGTQFVVIAAGGHDGLGNGQSDAVVAFALPGPAAASTKKR
jgi:quinoprotein glucose dehydrogenase